MLIVRSKFENIKPMDRQTLINIVSKSWEEASQETIIKSFKVSGVYGSNDGSFLNHQINFKKVF